MDLVCITVTEKLPFYFKRPPINVVSVVLSLLCESVQTHVNEPEKGQKDLVFFRRKNLRLMINRQFRKEDFHF